MAGVRCKTCEHPERAAIDAALVAGSASERDIAKRYGLNHVALNRHKISHLGPRIAAAQERIQREDETLAESILWSQRAAREIYENARGDTATQLSALGVHLAAIDRRAKWVDRLSDKHDVNVSGLASAVDDPIELANVFDDAARAARSAN